VPLKLVSKKECCKRSGTLPADTVIVIVAIGIASQRGHGPSRAEPRVNGAVTFFKID
jgi:hypothetical protein